MPREEWYVMSGSDIHGGETSPSIFEVEKHAATNDKQKPISPGNPRRSEEEAEKQLAHRSSSPPQHEGTTKHQNPLDDWNGPADLDNPHNWGTWTRVYHATVPGLFGFVVTFGTSVYTPALPLISTSFHISHTTALLGLTVYTLGLAFGPVISAPLSETHGRKIVYLVSSPIFMLFTLGAGFSNSFASLIVCRFFAGMAGSPALAVGAGTNADLFPPSRRAVVTSLFLMAPFAGPSLGPVIGGFAAQYKGWRWTQWCMLFISVAVYALALPMKETYKPVILARRAKKLGISAEKPSAQSSAAVKSSLVQNFIRPLHMLCTEPVVFFLSLYNAFAFAILFLFFAAFPLVFQRPPYNFTTSQSGLTFLGIGLGVLLASLTGVLIDRSIYQPQHQRASAAGKPHAQPEHRLYSAMVGSFGIPLGLFWFGWAAEAGRHWAVLVVAAVPFAWGNLCLFISAALFMTDIYGPRNGASALAANGIFRYTLGAVFPLFTVQMYQKLGTGWATSLLGFLSVLMLPIPWVLFKRGPDIRKRSRYPVVM
ncbi:major facilitator superfamily domain-containing protein [Massariosphaeria phaeospora]|uniref:Major facilitator superfamily domain-containing protein n=1 Tax=Massariosphaeria phaeospora TaxID=100035 RepID=A0A7C8IDV8_9PLEO|nr:major facilitator superfamily domain-containing protein [Massariosphaeria phaeospora]